MNALCQDQRLKHRTKHIALRYFLTQELQQRGQHRLAYVATQANTADVFTKALGSRDHQRFCTALGLVPTLPHLLDEGDEDHGDEGEEDWPENGHDDSASGDDVPAGGIDDDDWWTRQIGSGDDVEEWRADDYDNDGGMDAVADVAADAMVEAAADATVEAAAHGADADVDGPVDVDADAEADDEAGVDADTDAKADAEAGADTAADAEADASAGRDAIFFEGEDNADDPWRVFDDDDVPLLKRKLRHRLRIPRKRTWVVFSDDDSPAEEQRLRLSAADKGKGLAVEVPAKADRLVRLSKKKQKDDGDRGSSKGAKKQKKKAGKSKDDIVVNEALSSDDDYAEAAGPMPSFPKKAKPKDPTLRNANSRPPSPCNREIKRSGDLGPCAKG
ncbi:unnamed protein product [Closterium sp. NIES-54]